MKIPYKYVGILQLAALCILAPVVLWRFSLAGVVSQASECRRLERFIDDMAGAPTTDARPAFLSGRELLISGELLTMILPFAAEYGVSVGDYTPSVTLRQDAAEIHTVSIAMSGTYAAILRMIYRIETEIPSCKPVSLHFGIVSPPGGRDKERLEATLYIEQLVKTDNR